MKKPQGWSSLPARHPAAEIWIWTAMCWIRPNRQPCPPSKPVTSRPCPRTRWDGARWLTVPRSRRTGERR